MITGFEHVTLGARDVTAAAMAYEAVFGLSPEWRGASARFRLANIALRIEPVRADEPEGLSELAFAVSDLAEARRQVERRGLACGDDSANRGDEVRLAPEATHGVCLTLAQRTQGDRSGGEVDPAAIHGLDHLVIVTPNPDRALALYGARLGLDLRLERSNPAWNARLFFLRCGDAVVELSANPDAAPAEGPDTLSGLAWRAGDPRAAQRRMAKAGLAVSEVRAGRKAGTEVFTLRAGLLGAPALVIGPAGGQA